MIRIDKWLNAIISNKKRTSYQQLIPINFHWSLDDAYDNFINNLDMTEREDNTSWKGELRDFRATMIKNLIFRKGVELKKKIPCCTLTTIATSFST